MSQGLYARLRPILFRLDAERAHGLAVLLASAAGRVLEAAAPLELRASPPTSPRLERRLLGLRFPNPIGLAAGFDKNGVAPHLWPALGFGFAELGTVTGRPQPGNPRPRLFRLAEDLALVNRLGFNSQGSRIVSDRLARSLRQRPRIPIGLNIGASRAAMGNVDAELDDYRESTRRLGKLADYLVVNVSSPNTPGLRDLQEPGRLTDLVRSVRREVGLLGLGLSAPPVFVKLSPDLSERAVDQACEAALAGGAQGLVATNTTLSRDGLTSSLRAQSGGLSGAPLRERANETIRQIRRTVGRDVPLIGIGGIMSVDDVIEKLRAGADLVALYTGLIFEGPYLAARLARELDRELERRGVSSIASLADSVESDRRIVAS